MTVEVIIPWRAGCVHRSAALNWVLDRYETEQPGWRVTIAPAPPEGPWCKARAVMPAARFSTADVIVVADADVWCDELPDAVDAVEQGAPWAIPHRLVARLSAATTRGLLDGSDDLPDYDERPYPGVPGGGLLVLPAAVLRAIPIDPRFEGWGQEDESWACALRTLLGPEERLAGDLLHLWHPPQPRITRTRGSMDGWRLRRRYLKARSDPAAMRALLEEAHLALRPADAPLHHPEPQLVGDH